MDGNIFEKANQIIRACDAVSAHAARKFGSALPTAAMERWFEI